MPGWCSEETRSVWKIQGELSGDPEGHDRICFKKVAVVEDFFDIIYNLHVCKDGKEQKHMGQKRTYRAVSERYAFVPREAVTKFLVLCTECPRRSVGVHVSLGVPLAVANLPVPPPALPVPHPPAAAASSPHQSPHPPPPPHSPHLHLAAENTTSSTSNCSSTSRSQRSHRSSKRRQRDSSNRRQEEEINRRQEEAKEEDNDNVELKVDGDDEEVDVGEWMYAKRVSAVSHEVDYRLPITSIYLKHCTNTFAAAYNNHYNTHYINNNNNYYNNYNYYQWKDGPVMAESDGSEDELKTAEVERKVDTRSRTEWTPFQQQPLGLTWADPARRSPCPSPSGSERAATATPLDTASNAEDTSSNGNKDDEDDDADDDNDDDKIDAQYDPERLKAFNMFVRLFVDENLDRMVPISKQPKEKIQAIIDACARQFPEFAERTRKRIRTYLKSCRRNKRTRDSNGWETPSRPTPPHLTSIQAEQILATACENEAQNAKRMRLGLEPIAQPNPLNPQPPSQVGSDKPLSLVDAVIKTESNAPHVSALAKALERPLTDSKVMNGSSMYQASFQQSFQKVTTLTGSTVHTQPGLTPLLATTSAPMLANGPTDLSVKGTSKPTRPSLNAVEVAAVRQLITGYRESAAFLLRSADELENLLIHQQSP
ncbi:nucleolar protein 4-like [Scylla paramamosain]|uniref:nucleolar protein 4-like n=1 Tax=Scylla paramamosain TaxID=85552 RepID=UPI0030834BDB